MKTLKSSGGKIMNEKKKVLIADDSIVMRKMINDILWNDGFEVVGEAKDGGEALKLYKELNPSLVTMDIVMPREHGIDALRSIIEFDPDARVIVVSGLHQKSLLMEALGAGARDYVIKPFDKEELLEAARKCAR
jgi:two-component system chemotaxis response regulator CheY